MKLDRNTNDNGRGKYDLLKLRKLDEYKAKPISDAIETLERAGILDWGIRGSESEFMVIRLKDIYAQPALRAYSDAAAKDAPEWASEIAEMAGRSGLESPYCKKPD